MAAGVALAGSSCSCLLHLSKYSGHAVGSARSEKSRKHTLKSTLWSSQLHLHARSRAMHCHRRRATSAEWQELAGVLVFAAFPFVTVKAIANSSLGESLQQRLKERKGEAGKNADIARAAQEDARAKSPWYGPERPKWLGPLPFEYPQHLQGDLPADYGYDVLALGKERVSLEKNFNYEILHGRWAMLGALGVVVPELLDRFGGVEFAEPVWWNVGYAKLQGDTLDYLGVPGLYIAGGQGVIVIAIAQVFLMLGPEYARYTGIEALEPLGIYLPGDVNYPGGVLFDPLGLSKDPASFEDLKVKEMKHARLAMVAWLGFAAQAVVTRKGPVDNLFDFINDPWHENIVSYLGK